MAIIFFLLNYNKLLSTIMKKINSLLALGFLGASLAVMPVETQAGTMAVTAVEEASDVLVVTYNSNSGIDEAELIGTLADGTILGFNIKYDEYVVFDGAISSAASISVPEKISYNGTDYTVNFCGYRYGSNLDFDEATSVTSLTLPASIVRISASIPTTITDLHLKRETPPTLEFNCISSATTVWVPQSAYADYFALTQINDYSNYWYGVNLQYEGWEPQAYTVTVNTPGTLANVLLAAIEQWTDVNELTVIGHLNAEDMKILSRLKQLYKLDLSQTDITTMVGCSGLTLLTEVQLPSTVTEVGESAFSGCSKLKEISLPNATTIGNNAFNQCINLRTVNLPVVTSIGNRAFNECSSLTTVNMPAVTSFGISAFSGCGKLTTVSLPNVTTINESLFRNCSSLTTVEIPNAISIDYYAFYNCNSLTSIDMPVVTTIGSSAFYGCYNLTTVNMPVVTTISSIAFYGCNLTTVNLPACLQTLESDAFKCPNLRDVYCRVVSPITTTAFSSVAGKAVLHVPSISVNSYKISESWYTFSKIEAIDEMINQLAINDYFTIVDYTGLADKVDLSISDKAHLTVSAATTFNLGTFTQVQATFTTRTYDDYTRSYITSGISTLIPNNEVKADNVTIRLKMQTNRWNFITMPFDVNVADIEYPEGTLWVIRKYSGADRAALTGNTWQNMVNGTVLQAGEGYILQCANEEANNVEFVFHAVNNAQKNRIFAWQDVVKPLSTYTSERAHNRSWNLVGNPYPAYYATTAIEHNGVITVWNGRSYDAYSLIDDNYVLRPNEAFFVQCPTGATSMKFKAEGRTHESGESTDNVYYARMLKTEANSNRQVYNFTLANAEFTDRARLVINPKAQMDYEISCDASKFMSDNAAVPQLYVYDNGIRYAIDERPQGNGVVKLGMYFGKTGEYTIAMTGNNTENADVMLTDNETGQQVNLAEDAYTFTAQAGTNESRFTLQMGNETTGIDEKVNNKWSNSESLYDLHGRSTIGQGQKGIFIVKQNGKSLKVVK